MTKMSAKQHQIKLSALGASETPPVDISHKKLLNSFTWLWYFATRMTKITYYHYSPTGSGMYTAMYIFQYLNVDESEQLEALWDCFFSHYTESTFQIHFISLSSLQNLLRKCHCCGDSFLQAPGLCLAATRCRVHKDTSKTRRNKQRRCCCVTTTSWLILWSLPFFHLPDV